MSDSLANKYRPQTFEDVVGQENIVQILKNQIRTQQIKHGYLMTGGAGTGKTTCARIFAREINKERRRVVWRDDTEDGKVIEEMLTRLDAVKLAENLEHYDVGNIIESDWVVSDERVFDAPVDVYLGEIIEIDAASNNGVDNVRELRETCKYKPINGGYKVYVIDEVHMLSTGAFNALLKTLEEPPEHCVFVLCTTDPQKIPATILSRVQRFQFKRMTTTQIVDRLAYICDEEKIIRYHHDALEYIAKLANGGMRDAISILDTCSGYINPDEELMLEDVAGIIGSTDYDRYIKLIDYVLDHDKEFVIRLIEGVHQDGKDLKQFIKGFLEFILEVEKYDVVGKDYVSVPSTYFDDLDRLIRDDLFNKWFERLAKLNEWIKYDPNPKVLIEGCFLALCER